MAAACRVLQALLEMAAPSPSALPAREQHHITSTRPFSSDSACDSRLMCHAGAALISRPRMPPHAWSATPATGAQPPPQHPRRALQAPSRTRLGCRTSRSARRAPQAQLARSAQLRRLRVLRARCSRRPREPSVSGAPVGRSAPTATAPYARRAGRVPSALRVRRHRSLAARARTRSRQVLRVRMSALRQSRGTLHRPEVSSSGPALPAPSASPPEQQNVRLARLDPISPRLVAHVATIAHAAHIARKAPPTPSGARVALASLSQ